MLRTQPSSGFPLALLILLVFVFSSDFSLIKRPFFLRKEYHQNLISGNVCTPTSLSELSELSFYSNASAVTVHFSVMTTTLTASYVTRQQLFFWSLIVVHSVTDHPPRPCCSQCVGWRKRSVQSDRLWNGQGR